MVRASDGYYYSLIEAIPDQVLGQPRDCASCAPTTLDDPASWRAWDGSGFNLRMMSPYVTGERNAHVHFSAGGSMAWAVAHCLRAHT